MNDTETRLRDYLHAEANTVPGSAQGPGLELDSTGSSTRRWAPMALAAAGIAAALLLAVPFLRGLSDHQPSVSGLPAAVSTQAPSIPYAVTVQNNPDNPLDTWWAVLHDRGGTVENPGVKGDVRARVDGGWLVDTGYPDPKKSQAAVVSPAGKVRPIGPLGAINSTVSPDGREIAVALSTYGDKTGRVVVVDLKNGKEVSSVTVQTPNLELLGWNTDGIWMNPHSPGARPVTVWQPGSSEVRTAGNLAGELEVARGSGTVVLLSSTGSQKACAKAATLGAKGLVVKREYCFEVATQRAPYATLSPDGATIALSTGVAVDIATGKTTELGLPARSRMADGGVFEDPANLILVDDSQPAQKIFRCGVATGECKQLVIAKRNEIIALVQP
ncbi:hypothetical protein E0H75_12325 [Kribbella capetownensis]|uniref:WD40 repeat domain-containing protein n=1 Tax=Kribbella capetownensis TaxID=1572659 RepID=A0A4R0JU26_9ACTN|nr:hypothetical protein [Kribbella capetownensis]TCC50933.1 hypothetical protein E0H75_12325 [Kribbella capetownensis]